MASLRGLKGTVYENGIRVPCFVRWPQRLRPAKVDRIAAVIDVMPTVLAACGVGEPAGVEWDGVSLLPLLLRPDAPWTDRTLFFQWEGYPEPHRGMAMAVRNQRYKLVQPVGIAERQAHIVAKYAELCKAQGRGDHSIAGKQPQYELFDIEKDPGETVDLAPQRPELVAQMKKQYDAWFHDVWTRWHKEGS
jgi:arylsulfatase/arylsulfatase A